MTGLRYQVYEIRRASGAVQLGAAPLSGFINVEAARKWIDSEGLTNAAIILQVCPACGHVLGRVEGENSPPAENGQLSLLNDGAGT